MLPVILVRGSETLWLKWQCFENFDLVSSAG